MSDYFHNGKVSYDTVADGTPMWMELIKTFYVNELIAEAITVYFYVTKELIVA